ncbi:MAG: hypothetical protein Q9227_001216 [Pyrenula ochraceoflavens]
MFSVKSSWHIILIFLSLASLSISGPIQYCNPNPSSDIDFCLSVLSQENADTSATDLYITFSSARPAKSTKGWTAVGFGEIMAESLMIITYGDPASDSPLTSIRSTPDHTPPVPFGTLKYGSKSTDAGFSISTISSTWEPSGDDKVTATTTLLCKSCSAWTGQSISSTSHRLPFIWSHNPDQDLSSATDSTTLSMHSLKSFGNFYADMPLSLASSRSDFTPQSINSTRINHGMIDTLPASGGNPADSASASYAPIFRNRMWRLHGLLMTTSFLLLFPLGILSIRSGHPHSFRYHWILQVAASGLAFLGIALGLLLSSAIVKLHQYVGVALLGLLLVQMWAGWRHHVVFVRLRRRTWVSDGHVWLGRGVMVFGWGNLVSGMVLRQYGWSLLGGMVGAIALEAAGLWWVWRRWKVRNGGSGGGLGQAGGRMLGGKGADEFGIEDAGAEQFALVDQDEAFADESESESEEGAKDKADHGDV